MTQVQLPGVAEQEIEAHRADDEDAGRDQGINQIGIAEATRNRGEAAIA